VFKVRGRCVEDYSITIKFVGVLGLETDRIFNSLGEAYKFCCEKEKEGVSVKVFVNDIIVYETP
jgi:hypothetical protein